MFIPIIVQPPSPASQELGGQIAQLVREYCDSNPAMSGHEVDRALALARTQLHSDRTVSGSKQLQIAFFLLTLVFVMGVAIAAANHGTFSMLQVIAAGGGVVILVAVIFLMRR